MAEPSMNSSGNATHLNPPSVKWAQRRDKLLLTVELENCKDPTVTLKDKSLYFRGKGGVQNTEHEVLMEFNQEIDPESSKFCVTGRGVNLNVIKKDMGFWPRLLKDSKKAHWLKTDFDKWMDEEDSDVNADTDDFNLEDMMQSMGGLQGNSGAPLDEGEDSDDEDLPDLEGSS